MRVQRACDGGRCPGVTTLPVLCLPRWPWSVRSPTDTGVCVRVARTLKRIHLFFLKQKGAHLIWWPLFLIGVSFRVIARRPAGCAFLAASAPLGDIEVVPGDLALPCALPWTLTLASPHENKRSYLFNVFVACLLWGEAPS